MKRRKFISQASAALFLSGCSGATGFQSVPSGSGDDSLPEASVSSSALPPSTRAYAITGFMRDPLAGSSILTIDVTKNAFISRLQLPYTSGLRITMNRGGTFVYASQSPGSIPGKPGGPFPLIQRFSQTTRSIVQTYFLPTAFRYPLEQWEIALDSTESCLWIAYGKNGLLLLEIASAYTRHYNVPGTNTPLDVRCVCARGGHTVYVAGRDDSVGGRLMALDAVSGKTIRSIPIVDRLRPNYMLISDDGSTLYLGVDSPPSSPNAFDGVSHGLVYDATTFTLLKNQSFTTPQNAGAGGMALNPCNGWVLFGYEFFRGAQYLPSKNFWDWLDFGTFDGSGLAFSRNGDRAYIGTGLPAHIGIDTRVVRDGKVEYGRTGFVSGTPNLGNEHIIAITMN